MTTTATPTTTTAPEEHRDWCEHSLPEPLIRIAKSPLYGVYETDGSSTDDLEAAMSCALSVPRQTLKEALADCSDNIAAKLRLAIAQIDQIEIDACNIRFVHEDGMTDEDRLSRHRSLQLTRKLAELMREMTPEQIAALKVTMEEKLAEKREGMANEALWLDVRRRADANDATAERCIEAREDGDDKQVKSCLAEMELA